MDRRTMRAGALALLAACAALAGACGDDGDGSEAPATGAATAGVTTAAEAQQSTAGTTEEATGSTAADTGAAAAGAGGWPYPNYDLENTRNVTDSTIGPDVVDQLGEAWTVPIRATGTFGGYAATPVIVDGVVYTQDLDSSVYAIDLATGAERWFHEETSPTVGPNGVNVVDGVVYAANAQEAFALDAATGEEVWRSERLVRNANEGIDMAPGVHDGRVYVSTVPGNVKSFYKGNGQGVLWALDAKTGSKDWTFDTVPANLWSDEHAELNSGGGLWHAPAFDEQGGVYIAVANPAPWPGTEELPWGASRPGPNEHTNSLIRLDEETGELIWANQVLPHDIYDWDLHLSPSSPTRTGPPIVLAAGKMGYVYAMDRESGELLWKTPVGEHSGNDEDNQAALAGEDPPKLPLTLLPGILGGVETQLAVADGTVFAPVVNVPTRFESQTKYELQLDEGTGQMVALDIVSGDVRWDHPFPVPTYGAATVANGLVWTTLFDGTLVALDAGSGDEVWSAKLPAGSNSPVAIAGDTLVTAAGIPQGADQKAVIVAYRLGATGPAGAATTGADTGAASTSAETGAASSAESGASTAAGGDEATRTAFSQTCGGCHALADAGTSGAVGPSLDASTIDEAGARAQIANGGGGMPAFGGQLDDAQIDALAAYIVAARDPAADGGGGSATP